MDSKRPEVRLIRPGEMLAMHPAAIHSGPQGFFWLFGGGPKANERKGDVAIVHVRDALEHHDDSWSDNYESILCRIAEAFTGADESREYAREQERHEWRNSYKQDYQPLPDRAQKSPAAVLMCIDSPGGVVSGLNETVFAIQKMAKDMPSVPLIAYANEMAASAAFALACACPGGFVCPPSAIVGSIGVISTMISQDAKNKQDGYDVRLITSGDRKADGHLHAPITDAAVSAERERVMKLAKAFWKLAGDARGISPERLEKYQAAIYLGPDARRRGLVDRVESLSDTIASLSQNSKKTQETAQEGGNETDRRAAMKAHLTHLGSACQSFRVTHMAHLIPRRP